LARRSKVSEFYEEEKPRRHFGPSAQTLRRWRDRLLLLVEVGAIVGLILIFISVQQTRVETNDTAIAAQPVPPTPAPRR